MAVKIIPRDNHEQGQKWNFLSRYHSSHSERDFWRYLQKSLVYSLVFVYTYMHICACIYVHVHLYTQTHIYTYSILNTQIGTILYDKLTMHKEFLRICSPSLSCVPPFTCTHSTTVVFGRVLSLSWGFRPLRGFHPGKLTVSFNAYGIFQLHLFLRTSHYVKMPFWIALIKLDFIWKNL